MSQKTTKPKVKPKPKSNARTSNPNEDEAKKTLKPDTIIKLYEGAPPQASYKVVSGPHY